MNDDSPFASFVPSTEAPAAPETPAKDKGKRIRKGKGAKAAKVEAPAAPAKLKKERKPRAEKSFADIKVPLIAVQDLGALNAEEAKLCLGTYQQLLKLSKKSRKHIAKALFHLCA